MAKEKQSPTREQQPTTSKNKNLTPCVSSTPSLFSFFNLKNSQLGMSVSSSFTVTVAEESVASGKVALSPLDLSTRGRSVPSIWYFKKSLDPFALVSSLKKTLESYQVLCGQYNVSGKSVDLSNNGVPWSVVEKGGNVMDDVAHCARSDTGKNRFETSKTEGFFHTSRTVMDPDTAKVEAPVMAIKVTMYKGGGTAIGILIQHGVCDMEAIFSFVHGWSTVFRGEAIVPNVLNYERYMHFEIDDPLAEPDVENLKDLDKFKLVPAGEKNVPEFLPVMGKILGKEACVVSINSATVKQWKSAISVGLSGGTYISSDDVITAKIWRSMAKARCVQLNLPLDSDAPTTIVRAVNIRRRMDPPLALGYFGNAIAQLSVTVSVVELFSMSIKDISLHLRQKILEYGPKQLAARVLWMREQQKMGGKAVTKFDSNALTFIVSSWCFSNLDWSDANFGEKPLCFDHACFVPFVSVITRSPGGDGVNIWTSGTKEAVATFADSMLSSDAM